MVAMNIIISSSAIVILSILFFLSPSHCVFLNHKQNSSPDTTFRGLVVAEKTRLGSTPPSCHNKCNNCHPCMAVQVPTLPSHNRIGSSSAARFVKPQDYFESSPGNRYSNYKPLGWKCRCDGRLYNP